MPVGLVGKDGAKVADNVHDSKDKTPGRVEAGKMWHFSKFEEFFVSNSRSDFTIY